MKPLTGKERVSQYRIRQQVQAQSIQVANIHSASIVSPATKTYPSREQTRAYCQRVQIQSGYEK